jgi:hypothetical protein
MWEIFSRADMPYFDISNVNDIIAYLERRERLYRPEECPDQLYDIMFNCWRENPNDRPDFEALHNTIRDVLEDLQRRDANYYAGIYLHLPINDEFQEE